MDSATGALGVLLPKLAQLLQDEYNLHKNAKKDIEYVSKELQRIHATLRMVGEVPPENLTELVKLWAADIRELSYDMDDIVDSFLVRVQGTDERPSKKGTKRILEMMRKITKAWDYSRIGHEIRDIKERVKEVAERRDRYKVDTIVPATTTSVDPRVTALYTKLTELVGIDEPREELIARLTGEGNTSTQEQRIISIVGFGGLGKTTLAKAVYDELKMQFNCTAFVPVSRNPDMKKLLKDILYELDKQKYENIHSALLDERQLIDLAQEFLKNKRYFIVIDDIWSTEPWDILRCALVDNDMRSQIIITTRKIDVADQVGGYCYRLKPLSPDSSKSLFYRRMFGCGVVLPKQYSDVSENLLKKCGGVPLAIIATSGLLANKLGNVKEWYNICDSIGSGLGSNNYDIENMGKILSLSYYDLPSHLKTCLLYFSIFPEDYEIDKKHLIWRWIGEGFVQHGGGGGGESLFEIGESYFNGLVNRSLIQSRSYDDFPGATSEYADGTCSVHDMVHDLICSLSREKNFVTVDLHGDRQNSRPSDSKIRRLSIHGDTWPPRNISERNMSNVRSLTVFGPCVINSMLSSIPSYHLLRVLDLRSCSIDGDPNLMFIGKLLQLRYLFLPPRLYTLELLEEIAKLQHLQALYLHGVDCFSDELPPCILRLKKLIFLCVYGYATLPAGLGNLTSLEELWEVRLDSAQVAEELGRLTQLRFLNVMLEKEREDRWDESLHATFVASLGKLQKLQTLIVYNYLPSDLSDGLTAEFLLGNLRFIKMDGINVLPRWINPEVLPLLSRLDIMVSQVRREDIQVLGKHIQALGKLQALSHLFLSVQGQDSPKLGRPVVGVDAFPRLVECWLRWFPVVPSMFPSGAMPRLEMFYFCIDLEAFTTGGECDLASVDDDLALGHLPSLKKVQVWILRGDEGAVSSPGDEVATKVRRKLRDEANLHPNHPYIFFF